MRISKGRYLPFGILHSDHRGVWIDIPIKLLFGYKTPPIAYFGARRLKLIYPRVVKQHLELLYQAFHKHNLITRMDNLHQRTVYPLYLNLVEEYEDVDKLTEYLLEDTERRCRKLHTWESPWSPSYKKVKPKTVHILFTFTIFFTVLSIT